MERKGVMVYESTPGRTERILEPNIGRMPFNCRCIVINLYNEKEVKGERIDGIRDQDKLSWDGALDQSEVPRDVLQHD